MAEEKSIFEELYAIDVSPKVKEKNGFRFLPWATAWAEVKKKYPDATFKVHKQTIDELGNTKFWHSDNKSGWTEVSVKINGEEQTETLAIMDFKNKAIPAENITSTDANKSLKRCLVKCLALFGLGLFIYEGEDLPEETSRTIELKETIKALAIKKCSLSEKAKQKVGELCMEAEKKANPWMEDDLITGNYNNIDDLSILEDLEKRILAVRK